MRRKNQKTSGCKMCKPRDEKWSEREWKTMRLAEREMREATGRRRGDEEVDAGPR